MSGKRFAYKVVDAFYKRPDTYKSIWAKKELSKLYLPSETTHADADILEKGFGLFVFLDEEKAKAYAAHVYVVWKVEIGTIMPVPEKILINARHKSEFDCASKFCEAYKSENFNDWFMTDRVTLIEKVYDWRE